MKAAVYLGKEEIAIKELPTPVCGDNDVLIQNLYSGICGTDVAVFHHGPGTGHKITVGGEFGHETVSRVVAVGKNVSDFQVGERVYPYPRFAKGDTSRAGTIGGFSEYILVPDAKRNHSLYAVDEAISDKLACLIEPFTVGCRAARRSKPQKWEKAVVFGCGTIGLAAAVALQYFGLQQVTICDVSKFRLEIAKEMGFVVCNVETEDFTRIATDFDIFIDAAGAESVFTTFMEYGKLESRYVSVAVNKALRQLDLLRLTYSQKSIIGSGGYTPADVADVMEMMKSGRWNLEKMITHTYPFLQLEDAIRKAADVDHALNVTICFFAEKQV